MPRRGARGNTTLSTHKGFCISCGASKSSRFRPAPLEWEAFYHFYDDERNEKKTKICTSCYLKLSKAFKLPTTKQGSSINNTNPSTPKQTGVLVKPSAISGNGLFAFRDFVKGEVVTEYGGRILSLEETKGKDASYFRVIGLDPRNGIIDGKYGFGSSLGRYINSPKGNCPNCSWGKYNEKTKTITIKTNKTVKRGEEFTIRYGFLVDRMLTQ